MASTGMLWGFQITQEGAWGGLILGFKVRGRGGIKVSGNGSAGARGFFGSRGIGFQNEKGKK